MKLEGFGIFVKDMPVMVRFYRDVLGFNIQEDENTTNVFLEKDGTLFLLYRRSDFEKMVNHNFDYVKKFNGHSEIALSVENYAAVDKIYTEVLEKGAVSILEPTTEPWGQRTCFIADPEGNLIEIGSFQKE
jgi:lactoylglutathione lyase